jgi:hypothetical protein
LPKNQPKTLPGVCSVAVGQDRLTASVSIDGPGFLSVEADRSLGSLSAAVIKARRPSRTPTSSGPLAHILRNRVYLGELKHKGASYPGEHAPIIPPALFDAVQEKLTANRNGAKVRPAASAALLIGRVFDDHGHPMTPSTAKKGSIRYRYYISSMLVQGRRSEAGTIARVSAPEIAGRGRRCTPGCVPGRCP